MQMVILIMSDFLLKIQIIYNHLVFRSVCKVKIISILVFFKIFDFFFLQTPGLKPKKNYTIIRAVPLIFIVILYLFIVSTLHSSIKFYFSFL